MSNCPPTWKIVNCFHSQKKKKNYDQSDEQILPIKSTTLQKTSRDTEIEALEHIFTFKQGPNNLKYPFVTIHLDSKKKCGPSCTCRSLVILGWSIFLDNGALDAQGIVGFFHSTGICAYRVGKFVYLGILLGGFKPLEIYAGQLFGSSPQVSAISGETSSHTL